MKLFTTSCLVASVLLCFIFMWLVAQEGSRTLSRPEKLVTLQRMEVSLFLLIVCVIGSTVGSILIVRNARKLYREEAMSNMQILLEGAQAELDKKKNS